MLQPLETPKRMQGKSRVWLKIVVWLLLALFTCVLTVFIWQHIPSFTRVGPDFHGLSKPIFYQGKMMELEALGAKEDLKIPLSVIKQWIDPSIIYEEKSDSVIITTQDKVLRLKTDQLTASVNDKAMTLHFPVEKRGQDVYIPIEPLQELYRLSIRESSESGAVLLAKQGDLLQWGKVHGNPDKPEQTAALRERASIKSGIVADLQGQERVMIWEELNNWYRVQKENGSMGYVPKSQVVLDQVELIPVPEPKKAYVPWKPLGGKINLSWEQVEKRNPNTDKIGEMPGLNVISPTWFHLLDGDGNVQNNAESAYVEWAHKRGYQVWALFSNRFDPKITTAALSSYDTRIKIIRQLLAFAQMYKLQGFNIDFENVYVKDKANLTQLIREMVPLMHEQGLVVSIDVTVKSNNEMWSLFYDRKALGEIVDYMMVMTYDEHWATSPKAGSVASLPWVEKGIVRIMEEDRIPAGKLILGVPFYTRVWTEQNKDGKTTVKSKAVTMEAAQKLIQDHHASPVFSEDTGQNYAEYQKEGQTVKIWLEDERSIKARMELVKKYDLAGMASWRRGFEKPEIWRVIKETMETRP